MPLVHATLKQRYFLLVMDAPSTSLPLALFQEIEIEVHPSHPLHVPSYGYGIMETSALTHDPKRPHSYFIIRAWGCNCAAISHKSNMIHGFQLDSPIITGYPDSRLYCGLYQLGNGNAQWEPPHTQRYRREFRKKSTNGKLEEYTSEELRHYYVEGSVSEFIDWTDLFLTNNWAIPAPQSHTASVTRSRDNRA